MKKRIFALFLLLSVLCLSACQGAGTSATTKKPTGTTTPPPEEPPASSTPLPTGTTPLSELTKYRYETYNIHTMPRNIVANSSLHLWSLDAHNSMFPVQRIEPLGNDHLCVIYLFETDDGLSTYVYVIFDRTAYTSAEKPYQGWAYDSEFYFVSRKLSSADFSSIAVGDSAVKVSAIDPSLSLEMPNCMVISKTAYIANVYKLLTDGLLIMNLEAPRIEGETSSSDLAAYTVSAMTFYPHDSEDVPHNVSVLGYPGLLQDN